MVKRLSLPMSVRSIILILLMYTPFVSLGQEHRFVHINARDGLSHGHVTAIYRDQTGFLWIGTESGLNRFDGYTNKVFRNDASDSSSLFYDYISGLFKMPEGNMGVLTAAGPCLYDPAREAFSGPSQGFKAYPIKNPNDLKTVVSDKEGNFWFIINDGGLICYNEKSKKSIIVKHSDRDGTSIVSNKVTSIVQEKVGSYWIAHSNGMVENMVLEEHGVKVTKRLNFFNDRRLTKNDYLQCRLTADSDGDIWVYPTNYEMGVAYLNRRQGKIVHLGKTFGAPRLSSDMITGVVDDAEGNIWISNGQSGIDVMDKKRMAVTNMSHSAENDHTLSHNAVTTVLKDSDGIIWAGTFKGGLNYFHKNIMRFPLINRYSKPYGLPFDDINAFVEDKKGNLWLGTNGGGLIHFNRANGKFTTYRHDPKNSQSLASDVIVTLCLDHQNQLWIGTFLGGLNSFDGQKFTRYQHDPAEPKSLSGRSVWQIFEDSQRRLWIGTLDGGLCLFDRNTKTFAKYNHPAQRALYSAYVPTIFEDSHGDIWFGTSIGIDVLMKTSGEIVHYETEKNNPKSLGSNDVLGILEDSKGRIWIGTRVGLSVWQRKSNTFINYTEKQGLPHNAILSMVEDADGKLWLGTPNGLSSATISSDKASLKVSFTNYSEIDGLQGKQFNEDAALRMRSGELIFGGVNGFNIFRPRDLDKNRIVPRLVLTDFQLFNRSILPKYLAGARFTLDSSITTNPPILLHASDNVFSIEFAALSFIQPAKNQFKYKLEGFNEDWLGTDASNRKVSFTNLDAGDYVFRVIASNNDGLWNKEGIALNIKVLPPFWKSLTAYILYVVAIVLLLLAIRRLIQERERMKFAIRQTSEEAKRSRELDILKTKFFTNVSHELRTPLSLILAPVEKLSERATDVHERRQFELIQRNGRRLLNLVNQLLDFRKLEEKELRYQPSDGDIILFIKDTVYSFSDLSDKKEIRLTFNSNVLALETIFDHDKLEKILFNLLSNAIKFTLGPGEVSVTVDVQQTREDRMVEIRVKDTGIGIPPEKHDLIFERFFQNDLPNTIINQGSGIGLAITKEFIRIHGGSIRVESEVGQGSCFIVMLSLKMPGSTVHEVVNEPVQPVLSDVRIQTEHASTGKPLILIVEDNEDFRFYLKDNLKHSYSVIDASTGEEGWAKAIVQKPRLIVTDIMMPGLNGLDFCKMVKSDERVAHTPVILLTARSEDEQRLEGFEAGADEYIGKPFNFQVLESRIKNLITSREELHSLFAPKNGIKASEIQITSLDQLFLKEMVQVIEKHISNAEFSVTDLAREMGVSRSQFFKRVQTLTGKSPLEVIRLIRLQHAAQLLEKSQLSVSEIAYQVGFNNPKYFTRYFKEEYHTLPSAYAGGKRAAE
ncbi:hybrid sensor histidine kinase/response regulator transcription factor [Dyadobacter pollutisoli]|uniref:histidine kinase n=1 Tax=Dyadobacter pollutisoli TaxID=2910158 RepID=A0A9E8SN83_9BACT|nr:two-component regulator propeller domain-containing protein [Dyadobacter pollutisoli]WAC13501.1 ATP-binding protein [Dyadobacter pollutisoli]